MIIQVFFLSFKERGSNCTIASIVIDIFVFYLCVIIFGRNSITSLVSKALTLPPEKRTVMKQFVNSKVCTMKCAGTAVSHLNNRAFLLKLFYQNSAFRSLIYYLCSFYPISSVKGQYPKRLVRIEKFRK